MKDLPLGKRFDPTDTSETKYIEALYRTFMADLIQGNPYWKTPATRVSLRRHPEVDGRHAVFWHIVSGGSTVEFERELDEERCIRIGWIRPMLDQFNEDFPNERLVCWWVSPNPQWRGRRYGLATDDFEYVVFIEERENYALLVTAYFVEQTRRRSKFRKEHDEYWEKQEPPE